MAKQDLFLFYEENDDDRIISSNIVRLYMNRFTIEEDRQNEIVGVKNLTKPIFPEHEPWVTVNGNHKKRKTDLDKWRSFEANKLNQDFVIFCQAFEKIRNVMVENRTVHFIVGSTFYMEFFSHHRMRCFRQYSPLCGNWNKLVSIEKLIVNLLYLVSQFNIGNSFSCSFLCGSLITLSMVFKLASLFYF